MLLLYLDVAKWLFKGLKVAPTMTKIEIQGGISLGKKTDVRFTKPKRKKGYEGARESSKNHDVG